MCGSHTLRRLMKTVLVRISFLFVSSIFLIARDFSEEVIVQTSMCSINFTLLFTPCLEFWSETSCLSCQSPACESSLLKGFEETTTCWMMPWWNQRARYQESESWGQVPDRYLGVPPFIPPSKSLYLTRRSQPCSH